MAKRKLLYVEWLDAKSEGEKGWKAMADLSANPELCFSVGWVLHENNLAITLASSLVDNSEDYDGDITIPKSWILNCRELKCSRFPKPKPKIAEISPLGKAAALKDAKDHADHPAAK